MQSESSLEAVMLAEARVEVGVADHKASMILAALGVGFGIVLGGLLAGDWRPDYLKGVGELLWWVGTLPAIASIVFASSAVWPRFKTDDVAGGIYYWGHVATFDTLEGFVEQVRDDPPRSVDRTLHQLWRLSRIVQTKYRRVRWAMGFSGAAVVLFLLATLIGGGLA